MLSILHGLRGGTYGAYICERKQTMYSVKSVVSETVLASSDTHRYFLESATMLDDPHSLGLRD